MDNNKYLLFTWQPAWILINGPACPFTGAANKGTITHDKVNKRMVFTVTQGAKLSHDRQWELLAVRALVGGDITLFTKDPIGADEQALYEIGVITANTEKEFHRIFAANEEVIIKSASGPAGAMFLVREYQSNKRGT